VEAAPRDELVRTVSSDGALAVRALVGTGLVGRAALRHGTAPTASAALGRTLMGALLLAAGSKDGETVQIQVRGDGPIGTITAIADGRASVRGFAANPRADLPAREGKLDVGGAVGSGVLATVRYHPSWREPYTGVVPLVSGEIAEDLAHYLVESEQSPSAVALGVLVGPDHSVIAAGGFVVQVLPDADEEAVARLEHTVRALPAPTELVRSGLGAEAIVDLLLGDGGSAERVFTRPEFSCSCGRDRVLQAVVLLGRDEVRDIATRGEELEIRCEFCGREYRVGADEVGVLLPDA
jgi:molecular chaperone Hsp33